MTIPEDMQSFSLTESTIFTTAINNKAKAKTRYMHFACTLFYIACVFITAL